MPLQLSDISVAYGPVKAVSQLNLNIERGTVVAVIGPNGAGKTSLLSGVLGLAPLVGRIHLDGTDIAQLPGHARSRFGLGYVPSSRGVFTSLTVTENIQVAAGIGFNAAWSELTAWFPILEEKRFALGSELSGGQQQILSIARAMAARPRYILMDEPSIGLSPIATGWLVDAIRRLRTAGVGVLLTEQNAGLALTVSDVCHLMVRGEVRLSGSPTELRGKPEVEALYLGRSVRTST